MRTNHKNLLPTLFVIPLCLLLGSCNAISAGDTGEYDAESWKNLIASECKAFFDGCNNCRRSEGSEVAACTRKACTVYEKPRCLDESAGAGASSTNSTARTVRFQCEENHGFRVFYGEYVDDDRRVRLAEDEIMLSDEQTRTTHKLERERAASGAKYSDGSLEFREHGGEAMLVKDGQNLYQNCAIEG